MTKHVLPLSGVRILYDVEKHRASFMKCHGREPGEETSLYEWVQSAPNLDDRLRLVECLGWEGLYLVVNVPVQAALRCSREVLSRDFRQRYDIEGRAKDPHFMLDTGYRALEEYQSIRGPKEAGWALVKASEAVIANGLRGKHVRNDGVNSLPWAWDRVRMGLLYASAAMARISSTDAAFAILFPRAYLSAEAAVREYALQSEEVLRAVEP